MSGRAPWVPTCPTSVEGLPDASAAGPTRGLPLERVADAHRLMEQGSVGGKIILTP